MDCWGEDTKDNKQLSEARVPDIEGQTECQDLYFEECKTPSGTFSVSFYHSFPNNFSGLDKSE
jgi:hypothetical protein